MSDQNSTKPTSSTFAILFVAVLVGAIGLYTGNNGFAMAGAIFLVVAIILGINQIRNKK